MTQAQSWPAPGPGQRPATGAAQVAPTTAQRPPVPQQTQQQRRGRKPLSTPQRLRLLLTLCLVTTLVFGVTAASSLVGGSNALGEATHHTAQLTRIQAIQANLLKADATATSAFLVGGLEAPEQRAQYTRALAEVARLIPEAGDAQPADKDALQALNAEVVTYAATMELARANNRQGFPVGGAYLADAGTHLRGKAMPLLDNLVQANDARVRDRLGSLGNAWVLVTGVLALAALVGTSVLVARQFRRIVNVGLAVAIVLVLLGLIASAAQSTASTTEVNRIAQGSLAQARAAGVARVHAYEAKAFESLGLIARSRGGEHEAAWARASLLTRRALSSTPTPMRALQQQWTTHVVSHRKVRELDSDGRWDLARASATGTGPGSSHATFEQFDEAATQTGLQAGREAVRGLDAARFGPIATSIFVTLCCLGALAMAIRGVNVRLKEYA